MQIILLNKVENLGNYGDQIHVKTGYARNYLFPQGKAIPATRQNIERFKTLRSELEKKFTSILEAAKIRAEKINALGSVTILSKSGNKGKLFGSIGTRDIANAVVKAGIDVTKNEVRLPHGALRTVGKHEVKFQVHSKIIAQLVVNIIPK